MYPQGCGGSSPLIRTKLPEIIDGGRLCAGAIRRKMMGMISRTRSLMFLAAAGALAQPGAWTTLQDTQERAFSVEVPQGWKAQGGMLRKGPLDPRVQIDMTSPDGRVSMRIGDFGIGGFTVPTQQMVRLGFTEGKPYSAGQPPTTTTMAVTENTVLMMLRNELVAKATPSLRSV